MVRREIDIEWCTRYLDAYTKKWILQSKFPGGKTGYPETDAYLERVLEALQHEHVLEGIEEEDRLEQGLPASKVVWEPVEDILERLGEKSREEMQAEYTKEEEEYYRMDPTNEEWWDEYVYNSPDTVWAPGFGPSCASSSGGSRSSMEGTTTEEEEED